MEILIVLSIILILAAILYPVSLRTTARAQSTKCLNNLRSIGQGINAYLGEHNMILPTLAAARTSKSENVATLDNTLNIYFDSPQVFQCPADHSQWQQTGTSYYWNSVLNGQSLTSLNFFTLTNSTQGIPVISDKEGWHRYSPSEVNILYADGHVTEGLQFSISP